ncbi:MAG: dihydroorotate dehydrogenase [Phycisphaerales bacterium]|nr:dihydroorotate dehydrogenase [Phycisphaerales bacterium]MCI0629134.1 dihydroorotate dehydrogenase [Phycisphaerales bacterium]MCI0675693.1 dihydroorotate dehydrogenase [Phycisphaerales bacterium]
MTTNLAGIQLRNPLVAASGTCGYVGELANVLDLSTLGAAVTKSITRQPREGNPPWRIIDVPRAPAMLNAIGLANVGLDQFLGEKLPALQRIGTVVIGSIAGNSIDEYVEIAAAFDQSGQLPAVELNVSCPNTADGLQFGEHPRKLAELLARVRPAITRAKMIVKLSPNVADIVSMARSAIDAGADAITLINTMPALAIDVETRAPRLSRGAGGLSGPAIHPIAVRMVHEVYRSVAKDAGVPIIGLGGVMTWQDAAELILAGSTAVGMGTALFVDPTSPRAVGRGLEKWVARQGCSSVGDLIGQARIP